MSEKRKPVSADHATIAQRMDLAEELLGKGATHPEVRKALMTRWPGMTERTANRYLRKVYERWEAEGVQEVDRERKRREIEASAKRIQRIALGGASPDIRSAVAALELQAKLHGLLVARTELTGKDGGPVKTEGVARVVMLPPLEADDDRDPVAAEPRPAGEVPRQPR